MSGVLFFDAPSIPPRIQVLHGLVASTPFGEVSIERPGVYTETLTFEHLPGSKGDRAQASTTGNALLGGPPERVQLSNQSLRSDIKAARLDIYPDGRAKAELYTSSGPTIGVGFADTTPGGQIRSLALCMVAGPRGERSLALGGFIDVREGCIRLQRFDSEAKTFLNKYTAVTVAQEVFSITPHDRNADEWG